MIRPRASITADAGGKLTFEEGGVPPGCYAYGIRVESAAVGALGPGPRELRLSEAESLPGSVHFVRLRRGAKEVRSKALIMV